MSKIKKLLMISLSAAVLLTSVGCGDKIDPKPKEDTESKICEIKALKDGYDVDWLQPAVDKFNEIYKEQGYQVKIAMTDTSLNVLNEITTPKRNTTDIYFEHDNIEVLTNKSRSILKKNGVSLLEDLTDVFNSKAINENREEEGVLTIGERMADRTKEAFSYHGVLSGHRGLYALPYRRGSTGLYVNRKVLREKGYTVEELATTDGILKIIDELAPKTDPGTTGYEKAFFPVAVAGKNAPGYNDFLAQPLIAMYEGKESYENLYEFIPDGGIDYQVDNGYKVYEKWGIYEALKFMEAFMNTDYCAPGYSSMEHTAAQARVFNGSSLFMVSGDWIYKEMEKDYGDKLDDVLPIKTPVLSSLGRKFGLCGKNHEESYEAEPCPECEAKLKQVVNLVDANKETAAKIAEIVGVDENAVVEIRTRRNYSIRTIYPGASCVFMPSYSDAKTVGKLFLRFMFSDYIQNLFNSYSHGYLACEYNSPQDISGYNEREKAVYDMMNNEYTTTVFANEKSRIRVANGLSFYPQQGTMVATYQGLLYSHRFEDPLYTAKKIYEGNIVYAKNSWNDWVSVAGLRR